MASAAAGSLASPDKCLTASAAQVKKYIIFLKGGGGGGGGGEKGKMK